MHTSLRSRRSALKRNERTQATTNDCRNAGLQNCKKDLESPPGHRLKALQGDLKGHYSLRVNDQYRVTFRWENGHAFEVAAEDYH